MILEPEDRNRLLAKLIDTVAVVVALFLVVALFPDSETPILIGESIVLAALLVLRQLVRSRVPHVEHLLLAVVLASILMFDDGYGGIDSTWVLHIPLAIAAWILVESNTGRVAWLSLQALCVWIVNYTDWTPRLDNLAHGASPLWNNHVNLLAAVAASLLLVRHLYRLLLRTIREAQDQRSKAEAASKAKDEFLSHMSHELRTPLNAIQGFADLALQSSQALSPDLLENLRSIRHSADHLTHLVNDILDLAKLENGSLTLARGPFGPAGCIDEALDLLRPMAKGKRLELSWNGDRQLPRLMGDRVRWKQILLNLVGNAIKYTSEGSVRVQSRWEPQSDARGMLVVDVVDTGPGIAEADRARIFKRFHRLGGFDAPSGSGLGLAISEMLAVAMGGSIALESRIGMGSTFTLRIPFDLAPEDAGSQTHILQLPPRSLKGLRVLLAEDNRVNIRLASQVLRNLQADFDLAEDGGKALEMLRANRYDLLLLDLHMPVKDGFEVAQAIRDPKSDIRDKDLPILALTADAFEETRIHALQCGMDDFLSKPFRIVDLADRALRLVQNRIRPV